MQRPKARIYVSCGLTGGAEISPDDKQAHYLRHVLRVREGDTLLLFNGRDGEWLGSVLRLIKKDIVIRLLHRTREQEASPDIWLVFAPVKSAPLDYLVQKATELGVSKLLPVKTEHTIVARVNNERLLANAVEAAEQTRRLDVPEIAEFTALERVLGDWPADRPLVYGDESGSGKSPGALLPQINMPCALLIGPEGGFSSREREKLRSLPSTHAMSLGPRILRADTAAIAGLTCLQAWLGDWDKKPAFETL